MTLAPSAAPSAAPTLTVIVTAEVPVAMSNDEWQQRFGRWATAIPRGLSPVEDYEVGLTLTNDETVRFLNRTYRQQNHPTDVLAFAALEEEGPAVPELLASEPLYLGDIVISWDTARRQATAAGHPLAQELVWLACHGFLHLLGWDHPNDERLSEMLSRQQELIATFPVGRKKSS